MIIGILKTIVYILVFYYIFKIIMRLAAPFMAKKMMEKASKNFESQFNNPYYKERPKTKEGETYIEKTPQEKLSKDQGDDSGEFVDYEEID
ncbi:MAG TPA: DUF4834 family protein [Flavobacteriales bacterium]|jgi:hypothetical protein|nr:DUF4834 family protein [Flavobacteriales bacterium]